MPYTYRRLPRLPGLPILCADTATLQPIPCSFFLAVDLLAAGGCGWTPLVPYTPYYQRSVGVLRTALRAFRIPTCSAHALRFMVAHCRGTAAATPHAHGCNMRMILPRHCRCRTLPPQRHYASQFCAMVAFAGQPPFALPPRVPFLAFTGYSTSSATHCLRFATCLAVGISSSPVPAYLPALT